MLYLKCQKCQRQNEQYQDRINNIKTESTISRQNQEFQRQSDYVGNELNLYEINLRNISVNIYNFNRGSLFTNSINIPSLYSHDRYILSRIGNPNIIQLSE